MMTAGERANFLEQMTQKMKGQEFHDSNYRDNYLVGVIDRWIRRKKEDEIMEYEVIFFLKKDLLGGGDTYGGNREIVRLY